MRSISPRLSDVAQARGARCGTSTSLDSRHWFTVYGIVGLRSPVCRRCGAPNPRPLTPDEQSNYDYWKSTRGGRS
jgi:hypothetical protein